MVQPFWSIDYKNHGVIVLKGIFYACVFLLSSNAAHADYYAGDQSYSMKLYEAAADEFHSLLKFGHSKAIFRLGQMAMLGLGEPKDRLKALAYFKLAEQLGEEAATDQAKILAASLKKDQLKQVDALLKTMQAQVLVPQKLTPIPPVPIQPKRKLIHAVEPAYPTEAIKAHITGFTVHELSINAAGDVVGINIVESMPSGVFDEESAKVLKLWKFEPSPDSAIIKEKLRLDYSLDVSNKGDSEYDYELLLTAANKDDADAQYEFAELLSSNLTYSPEIDDSVSMPTTFRKVPHIAKSKSPNQAMTSEELFIEGSGEIVIDDKMVVIDVLNPKHQALKGVHLLNDDLTAGRYMASDDYYMSNGYKTNERYKIRIISLVPILKVNSQLTKEYWYEKAARNGQKDAQLRQSRFYKEWQDYLKKTQ